MKRVVLDTESAVVRKFIDALPIRSEGVELEFEGRVICRVIPADTQQMIDKETLVRERWEMIRIAQQRTKHMSPTVIDREIKDAIDEVRSQTHR